MGFFDKILIQKGEGIPVNITDLNQEHYEAFLHMTSQLKEVYFEELKKSGRDPIKFEEDEKV